MVTDGVYTKKNPTSATLSSNDRLQDKIVDAVERINSARNKKMTRTWEELIMLIQFVTNRLETCKLCSLSEVVDEAAVMFRWGRQDVFRVVNDYLDNADRLVPAVKDGTLAG